MHFDDHCLCHINTLMHKSTTAQANTHTAMMNSGLLRMHSLWQKDERCSSFGRI